MLNNQLENFGDESRTSIDYYEYDQFYVNLLFDHSIYRPICINLGNSDDTVFRPFFMIILL